MRAWIKSLRLFVCVLASFLAITGFKLAGADTSWVAVAAVFFIASATMLQNDWRDRFHDVRKGKKLVLQHQGAFLALLLAFWAVCGGLIVIVAVHNYRVGAVLAIVALAGIAYSETRKIPLVPIMLVSLASASPAVLPLVSGANSEKLWPLFLSVTLVIFAREITKDLGDKHIDGGYKWTIPLVLEDQRSRILVAVATVAGLIAATSVSLTILPAASLTFVGVVLLVRGASPRMSRKFFDAGMALVILTLIAFG